MRRVVSEESTLGQMKVQFHTVILGSNELYVRSFRIVSYVTNAHLKIFSGK